MRTGKSGFCHFGNRASHKCCLFCAFLDLLRGLQAEHEESQHIEISIRREANAARPRLLDARIEAGAARAVVLHEFNFNIEIVRQRDREFFRMRLTASAGWIEIDPLPQPRLTGTV